jgi:hypothetical protein
MASLLDCLGKIKLAGSAHFWNEADHAALMKLAKKSDDAGAIKQFMAETQSQIESISQKLKESEAKKATSSDPATAALLNDTDAIARDLEASAVRMEEAASKIEEKDPEGAEFMRKEAEFVRNEIKEANGLKGFDRNAISAAVECILSSPE